MRGREVGAVSERPRQQGRGWLEEETMAKEKERMVAGASRECRQTGRAKGGSKGPRQHMMERGGIQDGETAERRHPRCI